MIKKQNLYTILDFGMIFLTDYILYCHSLKNSDEEVSL